MGKKETDIRKDGKIHRSISVTIPDREDDEDPITKNQLRFIRQLAPNMEVNGGLESLGKWQASSVIEQIKDEKDQLESDIASGSISAPKARKRKSYWVWVIFIAVTFLYFVLKR